MDIALFHPQFKNSMTAPSSKSHLNRLILCALLSESGASIRFDGELSDDISAALDCAAALGASVKITEYRITVTPPGSLRQAPVLNCRSSGTALRFFTAVCAVLGIKAELRYSRQLSARPMNPLLDTLTANGAAFDASDTHIRIRQGADRFDFSLPGNISSQYLSGLLLAFSKTGGQVTLTSHLQSADYVKMTENVLLDFGCRVFCEHGIYTVKQAFFPKKPLFCETEGDWSNAAYALIGGAIGKGSVTVCGLNENSAQGDKIILTILQNIGVKIEKNDQKVTVFPSRFHGFSLSGANIPDLVPPLCVLAACADGDSVITDVDRLRYKETDRIVSTVNLINGLGGKATYQNGSLSICGTPLIGGTVNGCGDHRTVMTAALAATVCKNGVTVSDSEAVKKSCPAFFTGFFDQTGLLFP